MALPFTLPPLQLANHEQVSQAIEGAKGAFDGSGWTVSTGGGSASGGPRGRTAASLFGEQPGQGAEAPAMAGWPAALAGLILLVLLARRRKG